MTYGHAEIAAAAARQHDREVEFIEQAFDCVTERISDAPIAVQLGSVVGKAVEYAAGRGATREEIVRALSVEFDIYERSC